MITIFKMENVQNKDNKEFITGELRGLSTDTKPTKINDKYIENGTVFVEIDSGKEFLYDLTQEKWYEKKNSGGGDVDIQTSKSVEYTSNDTYAVVPDEGYDAIGTVYVDVNVPSSVNNETQSELITSNNTYTYTPSSGYTGIGSITVDVQVPSSGGGIDLTSGVKFGQSEFQHLPSNIENANWDDITDMNRMFSQSQLVDFPLIDTSNITSFDYTFGLCYGLAEIPQLDTSNSTQCSSMFYSCQSLEDVPVLDMSSVTTMQSMFEDCPNLTNQSLDNILEMCANVGQNYLQSKTLTQVGLSKQQAEICKTLSNYNDFVSAGWKTGYEKQLEVDIPSIIALAGTGTNYTLTGEYDILDGYLEGYGVDLILNDSINSEIIKGGIEYTSFRSYDSALTFDIEYNWVTVDDEQHKEYYFSNIQYNSNGTELDVDLSTIESEPARYDYSGSVDLQYVLIPTSNYRLTLTDNNLGTSLSGTATCNNLGTHWVSDDTTLEFDITYDNVSEVWYFENITYTPAA